MLETAIGILQGIVCELRWPGFVQLRYHRTRRIQPAGSEQRAHLQAIQFQG
jgi:hypothetical protein